MIKALFVGLATIDIIGGKHHPGGAAAAMSLNARHLNIHSSLLTDLAQDTNGQWYQKLLQKHQVDTHLCTHKAPKLPTCHIKNPFAPGSQRRWADNGALPCINRIRPSSKNLANFDLCFLANCPPSLAVNTTKFLSPKTKRIYIPGPQVVHQKDYVKPEIIKKAWLVCANAEEAPAITKHNPLKGKTNLLIITRGEKGGTIYTKNQQVNFDAPRVKNALDPTGAGDAFALGFSVSYFQNQNIESAIIAGKKLASQVIQKTGSTIDL